jgi:hypothetical protein
MSVALLCASRDEDGPTTCPIEFLKGSTATKVKGKKKSKSKRKVTFHKYGTCYTNRVHTIPMGVHAIVIEYTLYRWEYMLY